MYRNEEIYKKQGGLYFLCPDVINNPPSSQDLSNGWVIFSKDILFFSEHLFYFCFCWETLSFKFLLQWGSAWFLYNFGWYRISFLWERKYTAFRQKFYDFPLYVTLNIWSRISLKPGNFRWNVIKSRCFLILVLFKAISSSVSVKFPCLISRDVRLFAWQHYLKCQIHSPRIFKMVLPFLQTFNLTISFLLGFIC